MQIVDDEASLALGQIMHEGIIDKDQQHFYPRFFKDSYSTLEERMQQMLQFHWKSRADFKVDDWRLNFAVKKESLGIMGVQAVFATDFAGTKAATTSSYLGQKYQGQGVGKLMRAMVLEFAFKYLDADELNSSFVVENTKSGSISKNLGYVENGTYLEVVMGKKVIQQRVMLTAKRWAEVRPDVLNKMQVEGLEECLKFLHVS